MAHMLRIGTAELKNNLSKYLNEVRKGFPLIVTDHGKPIAKLEAIKTEKEQKRSGTEVVKTALDRFL